MNEKKFESKEEFEKFISKINLEDVLLLESSSRVISISGRAEKNLESDISLTEMEVDVIHNPENEKDFLLICSMGCNFTVKKESEEFLNAFAKVQAVYKVLDLDLSDKSIEEVATTFATDSAFTHIISYLRVYIMDIVNKSGFPRYTMPLFKQLKDSEYIEQQ